MFNSYFLPLEVVTTFFNFLDFHCGGCMCFVTSFPKNRVLNINFIFALQGFKRAFHYLISRTKILLLLT